MVSIIDHKFEFLSFLNLDDNIIEKVLEYGYPREALLHYLNKNELNNATTAYWLI